MQPRAAETLITPYSFEQWRKNNIAECLHFVILLPAFYANTICELNNIQLSTLVNGIEVGLCTEKN